MSAVKVSLMSRSRGADLDHQAEQDEADAVSLQKAHGHGLVHPGSGPEEAARGVNSAQF
jgi:hypothetical protein